MPRFFILAICSLAVGGCGTCGDAICGPADGHVYYRGVRMDVAAIVQSSPLVEQPSGERLSPAIGALMAADLPFSAVADTLLVPYLAYQEFKHPGSMRLTLDVEEGAEAEPCEANSLPRVNPQE